MVTPMPDRTDSGQGREALDAAMDALERCYALYLTSAVPDRTRQRADVGAARAAVRKAAREMGEEYEVKEMSTLNRYGDWTSQGIELSDEYAPGDRVRVIRVEGGK